MKVLISGSSGFLGSHLCQALLSKGYTIGKITQELLYSPKDLQEFFDKEQPDYIYHLAAYGNMATHSDVSQIVFSNIIGTYNMLIASSDIDYKAFIFTSSSSVYGRKSKPMSEEDVVHPETFYAASKMSAEHLCSAFAKQNKKPVMNARLFSVYGEGEADFRFIPTVIKSMREKKPFPLDEQATHDWIHISDVVDALLLIAEKAKNLNDKTINIGTGRSHTNKEICEMVKKISGIQYLATPMTGMRKNDSEVWVADNSYLKRLGWYPHIMLQEGLQKCWEYYRTS